MKLIENDSAFQFADRYDAELNEHRIGVLRKVWNNTNNYFRFIALLACESNTVPCCPMIKNWQKL